MSDTSYTLATMIIGDTILSCPEGTQEIDHVLDGLEMLAGPDGFQVAQDLINQYMTDLRCLNNGSNNWNAHILHLCLQQQLKDYAGLSGEPQAARRAIFILAANAQKAVPVGHEYII